MYVGRREKLLALYTPMAMCTVNMQGKVTRASEKISDVFKYTGIEGADIFALTRLRLCDIIEAAREEKSLYYNNGEQYFRVRCYTLGNGSLEAENTSLLLYFINITHYEQLKEL